MRVVLVNFLPLHIVREKLGLAGKTKQKQVEYVQSSTMKNKKGANETTQLLFDLARGGLCRLNLK